MLQIKNTLGGGKPEGLYAWKKHSYAFTEKSTSGMKANTFITTEAQNKPIKYYYSSSYSYDNNTGMFVLENPTINTIPYGAGVSPSANIYITVFSPSSEIMIKTSNTSGKSTLYNDSLGVYFHITNANYPYTLFESETTLSFIDYIVSDKETAYPDGGEKGGYWYERVAELNPQMFGYTKMAVDTFTPSSDTLFRNWSIPHSLGEIPKFVIIRAKSITSYVTTKYAETWNFGFLHNPDASSSASISMSFTCIYYTSSLSQGHDGLSMLFSSTAIMGGSSVSNTIYLKSGVEYEIITMA